MTVAALYDIHGNLPALEAVLRDVRRAGADRIIVGGDVVPGPMPAETLALLLALDLPIEFIHGNGESAVLACRAGKGVDHLPEPAREPVRWSAGQLDAAHAAVVARWPGTLRTEVPALGKVFFCHATPQNDTDVFTRTTPEARLRPLFDPLDVPLVICGHTHMQFDRMIGRTRVVNAGSVGMPFGPPGAYWLLLGSTVELRRTDYDVDATAERIRRTSSPQAELFATQLVQPPTEEQMLERYSSVEIT